MSGDQGNPSLTHKFDTISYDAESGDSNIDFERPAWLMWYTTDTADCDASTVMQFSGDE